MIEQKTFFLNCFLHEASKLKGKLTVLHLIRPVLLNTDKIEAHKTKLLSCILLETTIQ